MMLLLDTHVFLWYITADSKLPAPFRVAIQDTANEVFLSAVSVWEAVIKHGMGKLPLPSAPADFLPQRRAAHGISALPVDEGAMSHLAARSRDDDAVIVVDVFPKKTQRLPDEIVRQCKQRLRAYDKACRKAAER